MAEVHAAMIRELHELVLVLAADARHAREERGKLDPPSHNRASYLSGKEFALAHASRELYKITRHLPQANGAQAASDERQEQA